VANPKPHDVHTSADGKYRWVEGAPGFYHHDQQFFGAPRDAHPATQGGRLIEIPTVVLRCRCGDPDSHAQNGQHCPEAEVDPLASIAAATPMNVQQSQP
jgi:hypothetical protein